MANTWFRMYSEFATDPKVQMLSESDQRRLTMIFCLRCNGHVTLQDEEVTFLLRISNDDWQVTKALFIAKGFIDDNNEVLNWDKRQYISDSSAERVARHRAKQKEDVTTSNVTVTPPDTEQIQNRTDTEHKKQSVQKVSRKNALDDGFHEFWNVYPKKIGKADAQKKWINKKPNIDQVMIALSWQMASDQWNKNDGEFIPNPSTYINQERWNDEKPKLRAVF
jgi:hypothetical protein